jgi:hypothetical protein
VVLESLSHLDELGFFDSQPKPFVYTGKELEAAFYDKSAKSSAAVAELRPEVVARVQGMLLRATGDRLSLTVQSKSLDTYTMSSGVYYCQCGWRRPAARWWSASTRPARRST